MRLMLFTDTLADVNGVSRFIQDMASAAGSSGRTMRVVTSSRLDVPPAPNIVNLSPAFACAMPGYPQLELAIPPVGRIRLELRRFSPDVVHVSTPGPVGLAGLIAARRAGIPVVGTYHTDFPAFVDKLLDDAAVTWLTRRAMTSFYTRTARVLTRSADYVDRVAALGVGREKISVLASGVDLSKFSARFRDERVWSRLGVPGDAVKVLSVGRVSVEKNLPLLVKAWRDVTRRLNAGSCRDEAATEKGVGDGGLLPLAAPSGRGTEPPPLASPTRSGNRAVLVVVGDGPYRAEMERELAGLGAHFVGFRGGEELSAIYASSDLFVFPSTTDTLGQVALESQASGIPVLVSDVGGPRQVVQDGRTGLVLPADDTGAWARAIVELATDADRRRSMGRAGEAWACTRSIGASFEHFWRLHEDAVSGRVGAAGVQQSP